MQLGDFRLPIFGGGRLFVRKNEELKKRGVFLEGGRLFNLLIIFFNFFYFPNLFFYLYLFFYSWSLVCSFSQDPSLFSSIVIYKNYRTIHPTLFLLAAVFRLVTRLPPTERTELLGRRLILPLILVFLLLLFVYSYISNIHHTQISGLF